MDEWARARIEALEKRVAALERQLSMTAQPSPDPNEADTPASAPATETTAPDPRPDPNVESAVVALVRKGKALEAIHVYVNMTGADMASAKAEVGRIASSLSPQDFAT